MAKTYEVLFQDEYNNLWFIGFYRDLKEAIPDVNDMLSLYNKKIDELPEYASTFGTCFDMDIETEQGWCMVRGFIFEDTEGRFEQWRNEECSQKK